MARSQQELQTVLEETDAQKVYSQPPSTLEFPCIVFENDRPSDVVHADNIKYVLKKGYTVTVIAREPDSPLPDQVEALPHCTFDRRFKTGGLYHTVYQLFF